MIIFWISWVKLKILKLILTVSFIFLNAAWKNLNGVCGWHYISVEKGWTKGLPELGKCVVLDQKKKYWSETERLEIQIWGCTFTINGEALGKHEERWRNRPWKCRKTKEWRSQRVGWVSYVNVEITRNDENRMVINRVTNWAPESLMSEGVVKEHFEEEQLVR